MGTARPVLVEVVLGWAAGTVVDGAGTPEVKGLPPEAVLAPLKAGGLLVADGMGTAVVFWGLSTLRSPSQFNRPSMFSHGGLKTYLSIT